MWLQRVQQGAAQAAGKAGPDLPQFLLQIAHAARVLFFQPLLLHAAQVAQYVRSVGAVGSVEPADSMQQAMQYPSDSASDAERVEWLHLNLLIQFQSLYRDVLCNAAVFELHYSNAEAGLFQVGRPRTASRTATPAPHPRGPSRWSLARPAHCPSALLRSPQPPAATRPP